MTTITLKNLKHAAFASHETHCFSATVYVDGKRFCLAENDGRGGCDMYTPLKSGDGAYSKLRAEIEKIDARLRKERADEFVTHTRSDGSTFEIGPTFEIEVGHAVNSALAEKELKSRLRRKWVFRFDGTLYEMARRKGDDQARIEDHLRSQHGPDVVLLNGLAAAEALEIWRA